MIDSKSEGPARRADRKLGDEWADWDERSGPGDSEIDEGRKTFSVLAALFIAIVLAALPLIWYLVKPRIEQLNPFAAQVIGWSLEVFIALAVILVIAEYFVVLKLGKSLFPYAWLERVLLSLLPRAVWLGSKVGISRDRVGNSFIKVHNFVTKSYGDMLNTDRLLVLLPRCLRREARSRIMEKVGGDSVKVLTVGGGEEARAAIKQYRPTFILALACERDLMGGIRDVAEKIPVLAIANKRPEGPCKNTDFSTEELEEALEFIAARKTKKNMVESVTGS